MWVILAFISALFLGLYEATKKRALQQCSVFGVLWGSSLVATLLFLPVIIISWSGAEWLEGSILQIPRGTWLMHGGVAVKAMIVLASWGCGYMGLKHLPITLAAPIDALRPVPVLLGAFFIFAERPNGYQWTGIFILLLALYLLGRSGQKEGIHFRSNVWVWLVGAGTLLAAASGLYDKFLIF
ncbi:MAG: DMT family transporter [Elusimicrobiaceae bacterium]|nr:DMT family transporter [Elusimicrobiaceae bacterium]